MSSHSHIYTLSQKQTKPITATDIATVIAKDMATVIDKDMASDSHRHCYLQPPTKLATPTNMATDIATVTTIDRTTVKFTSSYCQSF